MQSFPLRKFSMVALLSVAFSSFTYSADIVRTLRTNADRNSEPENFFEIGLGAGAGVGSSLTDEDGKGVGLNASVQASYNWKGFFVDFSGEASELLVIGYNAYNLENWSFDVVLGTTGNGITNDTDDRFEGLNKREGSSMLGGRATGYYGKNIIQLSLKHDVSGRSQATVASALIGRNWQYKNWHFYGLVGLSVADKKQQDYFLGVSEEEASRTNFEAYDGKTSVKFNSSVGATYHISESWEFRATAYVGTDFGRNDSPLFSKKRDFYSAVNLSIIYKF